MRHRFAVPLALVILAGLRPLHAQGRVIDEGTFAVTRAGVAHTENFRIARAENGLIKATGQVVSSTSRLSSVLTVDSLGTPVEFRLSVTEKGAKTATVAAMGGGGRLTAKSSDQHGDESMREYPLTTGQSLLLDDGLMHPLYFVALGRRPGSIQIIDPRASRAGAGTLAGLGLEPVEIGGKALTATHYSLVAGAVRRDFWVDASGRLLRIEVPSQQLVATREELPR